MQRPSILTAAGLAAVLAVLPSTAGAQTAAEPTLQQRTEAATGLVQVDLLPELLGATLLRVEETAAAATVLDGAAAAAASVDALALLGQPVSLVDRLAESEGSMVVDPETEEDRCAAPEIGVSGVSVGLVCTTARAAGDDLLGSGEMLVGGIDVGGEVVATLLSGAIGDELDPLLDQLGVELLDDLTTELAAICDPLLAELDPLVDSSDELLGLLDGVDGTAGVEELIGELNSLDGTLGTLGELSTLEGADQLDSLGGLGELVEGVDGLLSLSSAGILDDLALLDPGDLEAALVSLLDEPSCTALLGLDGGDPLTGLLDLGPLTDAISELDVLSLAVDPVRADTLLEGDVLEAVANQPVVRVSGPSLDPLDDVVSALLETAVRDLLATLDELSGGLLDELRGGVVPTVDELVAELEAALPIFGDSAPLVSATIGAAVARAGVDQLTGEVTSGVEQTLAEVSLAPSIVELLGGDPDDATVTVAEGQSQTVGEGTPLASTITLASSGTVEEVRETQVGDLDGVRSTAAAVRLDMLQGVLGGIDVQLGGVTAASFAGVVGDPTPSAPNPAPDPDPETPQLPNTGGGAVALGVAALLGAGALRRRR